MISGMIACRPAADPKAQQALNAYTHFVDSIVQVNETWKFAVDSDFVEVPVDPSDPSKVRIDTIVTLPETKAKSSIVFAPYWEKVIMEEYAALRTAAESNIAGMDESMKKRYAEANAKYETLLNP